MKRMDQQTWDMLRARHVTRIGDPTYVLEDVVGALLDEVQACWAELRRVRADNEYVRDHIGNAVEFMLAMKGDG